MDVSAHQTSSLARPSSKPRFPLHFLSPSPFFRFGLVGFISHPSPSYLFYTRYCICVSLNLPNLLTLSFSPTPCPGVKVEKYLLKEIYSISTKRESMLLYPNPFPAKLDVIEALLWADVAKNIGAPSAPSS